MIVPRQQPATRDVEYIIDNGGSRRDDTERYDKRGYREEKDKGRGGVAETGGGRIKREQACA